ncbi:MAG TPA: hypothetical protein VEX18_19825, partial [Polyangiaceae bacterium]|nr:hypothetical protein [Polyangiaceae bacterium]
KSHGLLVAIASGAGLLVLGGGYLVVRGAATDSGPLPSASSGLSGAVTPEPQRASAAAPTQAPPTIASEQPTPPVPSVPQPGAATTPAPSGAPNASLAARPAVVSPPAPAPAKPGRAEQKGLAKDNPFK